MNAANQSALSWLKAVGELQDIPSPLGENVAGLLEELWGIHNAPIKRKFTDWTNDQWIEVVLNRPQMATVDDNRLTALVVRCHDRMLRADLMPHSNTSICIEFHLRTSRTGRLYERCPDILEHVKQITETFKEEENHA